MHRDPMTVRADDRLDLTEDLMSLGRVRHLPVLDGERLVGVVSLRDLLACSLSRAGTSKPSIPSRTTSRQPGTSVALIGRPAAAASIRLRGGPSR